MGERSRGHGASPSKASAPASALTSQLRKDRRGSKEILSTPGVAQRVVVDKSEPGIEERVYASLRGHPEVELIGLDPAPAMADCVSLVLTLENKGIAIKKDLQTYTTQAADKSYTNGIKVILNRGPVLVEELDRKKKRDELERKNKRDEQNNPKKA